MAHRKGQRRLRIETLVLLTAVAIFTVGPTGVVSSTPAPDVATAGDADASEAFDRMMQVLTHPRCLNCHPAGDQPRQGENGRLHRFGVQRGADGHGTAALTCGACHQAANNDHSGVPGAPHWHLAPRSMAWEGLSSAEIARSMLDPERNGGRSPAEIEAHLTTDALVLWAFEPGVDHEGTPREKPPISESEYIAAVEAWFAAGTPIPESP